MPTLPIIQATINQRDNNGNAYAAIAESPPDALGDFIQAFLRYGLQDNRFGWAEVYKVKADGSKVGIGRVETLAEDNLLKPDDVCLTVNTRTGDVRVAMTAHATSLVGGSGGTGENPNAGEEPDIANAIVGRVITAAAAEFPGLWAVFPTPAPAPVPTPEPPITCVPPLNRPHFRPNRNVTRAQLCKIMAIALGLPEPPAGTQTFEDIPDDSTFYQWIEAIYAAGAINGYPCTPE